ncbi:uncharacterized protein BO88DRAFT_344885, partial [Aspergillus vadensis CBS 113365]
VLASGPVKGAMKADIIVFLMFDCFYITQIYFILRYIYVTPFLIWSNHQELVDILASGLVKCIKEAEVLVFLS